MRFYRRWIFIQIVTFLILHLFNATDFLFLFVWLALLIDHFPDMAQNIIGSVLSWHPLSPIYTSTGVLRHSKACTFLGIGGFLGTGLLSVLLVGFFSQNNCMHSVDWSFFWAPWKEFFAFDSTSHDITYYRVLLWKVCGKIHFLPTRIVKNQPS